MPDLRSLQRGYKSVRVKRLHIIREGARGRNGLRYPQTWCGQTAADVTDSTAIARDTPHVMPEGLTWCPTHFGHAAEHLGRLSEVAQMLGLEAAS